MEKQIPLLQFPGSAMILVEKEGQMIYQSNDNDPFIQLIPINQKLKASWYWLDFEFKLHEGDITLPKIYFDYGDGYSELNHWKLFYEKGKLFGLIKLAYDAVRLRLDLSETNVVFTPMDINLKTIYKPLSIFYILKIISLIDENKINVIQDIIKRKNHAERKKLLKRISDGSYFNLSYHKMPQKHEDSFKLGIRKDTSDNEIVPFTLNEKKYETYDQISKKINGIKNSKNYNNVIDIIIPVYNGLNYLEKLIPQLIDNSVVEFNLIICDDKSSDPSIKPFLHSFAPSIKNYTILENNENLGFTKTVNKLIKHTKSSIIVLLNSDIEVSFDWLRKLIQPIVNDNKVATVTPISNSATICSFPNIGDNSLLEGQDVEGLNKVLEKLSPYYEEIPTGVGYCMAINRAAIDKVGLLNEIEFPRGYGEEVDFCFRAAKAGFKNILNTNLFVYHKHGGSFTSVEKQKLMADNQLKLERLHPEFADTLHKYLKNSSFVVKKISYFVSLLRLEEKSLSLFLDHDLGGGTNTFSSSYMEGNKDKIFLYAKYINPNYNKKKLIQVSCLYKNFNFQFYFDDLLVLLNVFKSEDIPIQEIIINNLVSYSKTQSLVKQFLNISPSIHLKVFVHDYYPICPNFLLLRENIEFCNIPSDPKICEQCISKLSSVIDPLLIPDEFNSVADWRNTWSKMLYERANEVVLFSESAKNIFLKAYPNTIKKLLVVPHKLVDSYEVFDRRVINICVLGNIFSIAKGAGVVKELASYISMNNLKNINLMILGSIDPAFDHHSIKKLGKYSVNELDFLLKSNKIDVVFIPSIWAETFSYTTLEAIKSGVFVASFDLGGQVDQIKNYKKGIIIKENTSEAIIKSICSKVENE